ncbi:MAG: hypothetical protein L0K70_05255 [Bifidobacterium crudilactis]|nr:hypothetical protein [Bifidobacterium crudilactis]
MTVSKTVRLGSTPSRYTKPGDIYTFHHRAPHFTRRRTMIDEESEAFREEIRKYDITPLEEINSAYLERISWV